MKRPNTPKKKINTSLKYLSVATITALSATVAQAASNTIGDLQIYQKAGGESGAATVFMMLDISNSMILKNSPSGNCSPGRDRASDVTAKITDELGNKIEDFKYSIPGCNSVLRLNDAGTKIISGTPTRLAELKVGIMSLLADGRAIAEIGTTTKMGVGIYPYVTVDPITKFPITTRGLIGYPAKPLTLEHRKKLMEYIKNIKVIDGATPISSAYAEAGAYMMGTTTKMLSDDSLMISTNANMGLFDRYSGFSLNNNAKNDSDSTKYASPIPATPPPRECGADGYGIFFLTDGQPNLYSEPVSALMAKSLSYSYPRDAAKLQESSYTYYSVPIRFRKLLVPTTNTMDTITSESGWKDIAEYGKLLRTTKSIRTATVGFGSDFTTAENAARKTVTVTSGGKTVQKEIVDCTKISGTDTNNKHSKNLCLWGELGGQYGGGGFTATGNAEGLATAIKEFALSLKVDNTVPASPAGTISIPDDPFSVNSQQAVAYLPMLQPDLVNTVSIWEGNLKKYSIVDGTIFGLNSSNEAKQLYTNGGIKFNKAIRDLWAKEHHGTDNSAVTAGGVYAHIKVPTATNRANVRTVYIEDDGALKKLSVNADGKMTVDGAVITDTTLKDSVYTADNLTYLAKFMGFDGTMVSPYNNVVLTPNGKKIMGGVVHSVPSSVTYEANVNTDGTIGNTRDEYMLFGSMDGALHLVNAANYTSSGAGGQEQFAIITKAMLDNPKQAEALSAKAGTGVAGQPNFGVDAPWLVAATYVYNAVNNKIAVSTQSSSTSTASGSFSSSSGTTPSTPNRISGMMAYGGFRLGAKGLYGIDLTDKNSPELAFSIPASTTGNFNRIAHIWNKPVKARIKMNLNDTYGTDVLIFGGGYDRCYDDPEFQIGANTGADNCKTKTEADGSALYIVKAKTGDLIWSASSAPSSSVNTNHSDIKHSIVGEVEVVDGDNDGFIDHIYFADLGGQVFRADFLNAGVKTTRNGTPTANFTNHRVVKLFSDNERGKFASRFFEKPVVGFHDGKLCESATTTECRQRNASSRFALVNVISGDRSNPLSKMRTNPDDSDRLYGIFDEDMTKTTSQLFASSPNYATKDLTKDNLIELGTSWTATTEQTEEKVKYKNGWYYPLIRFDGWLNVFYNKGVGKMERISGLQNGTIHSYLYSSVYNPDMRYGAADACTAQVKGGSEIQAYCLPYGICSGSKITAGYVPLGEGIKELAFGPVNEGSSKKTLVSMMTPSEQFGVTVGGSQSGNAPGLPSEVVGNGGANNGGTGSPEKCTGAGCLKDNIMADTNFKLIPKTWYDMSLTTSSNP